ncbi:hypothetical protein [Flavobacterium sp.]|jgi:hypothetical protein|uniref:hypothetical protein n=1 Tax=Flavobacterium sp. TaxID=239 RepID=UPI0037C0F702
MKKMKKMKNLLLLLILTSLCSCEKKENINEINDKADSKKTQSHKSFTDFSKLDYRGQLPYLSGDSENNSNKLALEYNFNSKIIDKKITWEYFDAIYNDDLSIPEKQNLAYVILSLKDLLGLYDNNKNNSNLENKIIKYSKILVETKYIGYCLLFNCLKTIQQKNPKLVNELSNKIITYSASEDFHTSVINDTVLASNSSSSKYYYKIKENYTFLEKIKFLNK